jgi:cell division protein ZapA
MGELSLKIKIHDREYPIKVTEQDVEMMRDIESTLNERISNFRKKFKVENKQDLLAMVAFDLLVELTKKDKSLDIQQDQVADKVTQLNRMISEVL